MENLIFRRLLNLAVVFFASSIAAMILPRLASGDAAVVIAGADASPAALAEIRQALGLSLPLPQQYLHWLSGVLHGDLGTSYITGRPVVQLIADRLGSTLELTVAAMLTMIVCAIPLGIAGGSPKDGLVSWSAKRLCDLLLSVPPFLLGLLMALFFGVYLGWLPVSGEFPVMDYPSIGFPHLIMPVLALALPQSAAVARMIQAGMREIWSADHVDLAIAKGLKPGLITFRHVFRNSLGPAIVALGLRAGEMLAGAVIIEAIFARAGLGALSITAILNRDYLVLQALIVGAVVMAAILNIVTEILLAKLDPRISAR